MLLRQPASIQHQGKRLWCHGNRKLLKERLHGILCSKACPGEKIIEAIDLTQRWRAENRAGVPRPSLKSTCGMSELTGIDSRAPPRSAWTTCQPSEIGGELWKMSETPIHLRPMLNSIDTDNLPGMINPIENAPVTNTQFAQAPPNHRAYRPVADGP